MDKSNMAKKNSLHQSSQVNSPSNSRLLSGGRSSSSGSSTRSSEWEVAQIEIDMSSQVNDNDDTLLTTKIGNVAKITALCVGVLVFAGFTGVSYTNSIHNAIKYGNDAVLSQAMTKDEQQLAYVLNRITIGQ